MSKETPFMVYCLQEYKNAKGITGVEALNIFEKYSVLEYIHSFYECLHINGSKYIINDIDLYIEARQQANH